MTDARHHRTRVTGRRCSTCAAPLHPHAPTSSCAACLIARHDDRAHHADELSELIWLSWIGTAMDRPTPTTVPPPTPAPTPATPASAPWDIPTQPFDVLALRRRLDPPARRGARHRRRPTPFVATLLLMLWLWLMVAVFALVTR